jgi:uncharacterized protein involved in exopolysaccharide biosynthesis
MEQEIDLRAYMAVLLKFKFWIAGLALIAAVVAAVVSLLLSPTYEAIALVAITKPQYAMQFDERFATTNETATLPPYKAYPELAMGDEILSLLLDEVNAEGALEDITLDDLRDMVEAQSGPDPSLVELSVRDGDPQRAAHLANRWAWLLVDRANELYGQSQSQLAFFEGQLAEAEVTLAEAEQAVIAFQARNQASILNSQLSSQQTALNEYLNAARSLRLIIQDAGSLRERMLTQDAADSASLSDELASLSLEIDALNRTQLPVQLQISGQEGLGSKTVGEQVAFLDSLIGVLENKLLVLEQEAKEVEPDILDLQERLQQVNTEGERLTTAKSLARETYVSLSRKVAEARISAQDQTGDARVASVAAVPIKPVAPRKAINTLIAGALGLFLGVLGAFIIEYWRKGRIGEG